MWLHTFAEIWIYSHYPDIQTEPPKYLTAPLFQLWTFFHPQAQLPALLSHPPKLPTPPLHPITILLLKWRWWWCNNSVNDDNILSGGNSIWGALIAHFGYGEGGVGGCVELMGKWPELQKDRDLFNYTRGESSFHHTHPTVGNNTVIFRKVEAKRISLSCSAIFININVRGLQRPRKDTSALTGRR